MEKFIIEAAGTDGLGHSFTIQPLNQKQYKIFNEQQERLATIEIDNQDPGYCRQSLDCRIDIGMLMAIRESILMHDQLLVK